MNVNPYLKSLVSVGFTMLTGLGIYYGHSAWYPIVTAAVGSLMVYLTPNTPAAVKEIPPVPQRPLPVKPFGEE